MNNSPLVTAETRERVLAVANRHGYAVNRNARRLRQPRAQTVAVMLDWQHHRQGAADSSMLELLAGVSGALSVRGQDLLLSPPGVDGSREAAALVTNGSVDGIIFLDQGHRDKMLRHLARKPVPFVVWGAVDPADPYCAVGSDNRLGGALAGDMFARRGAARWLFVGGIADRENRMRWDGLSAKAAEVGAQASQLEPASVSFEDIYAGARAWLDENPAPDAVFAFSDTAAIAVASAFREKGLEAPRDYALCGYNNLPPAESFTPRISTVAQDVHAAGALLVEKLMQLIDGGRAQSAILPTRLIERDS